MTDVDVLVIGSGAGGLTAAVALARAGKSVRVVEQHYVPGGWCHSFQLEGYRFSPGVHYIGQLGAGGSYREILEGLDVAKYLTFFEVNPDGYEHCQVGDERFDFPRGKDALAERLKQRFPKEARGIDAYLFLVAAISGELGALGESYGFLDTLMLPWRTRHLGRYGLLSLQSVLNSRVKDPLLRSFLTVQCGDHGMPPSRAPFALHASIAGHYFDGAYYPRGGGGAIANALAKGLAKAKGTLQLRTSVKRILIEAEGRKRRAVGVELEDGTQVRAGHVISNADPHATFLSLIGEEHLSRGLRKKLHRTKYSTSGLSLFAAVDLDLAKLGFDSGNYWYANGGTMEEVYARLALPESLESDEPPGMFLSLPSLKDPTAYDGKHHLMEAFTFVPYSAVSQFEGADGTQRAEGYEAFKVKQMERLLRGVERIIPGVSKHLVFKNLGTPLTNNFYVRSTGGSLYGTEKTRGQLGPFGYAAPPEIAGLRLVGASTLGHGVFGASLSGMNAAASILGCRPSELLQSGNTPLNVYPAEDRAQWPDALRAHADSRQVAQA